MQRRFTAVWAACFGLLLGAVAAVLLVLNSVLIDPQRTAFHSILTTHAAVLILVAMMGCVISAFIAHCITQAYFKPLRHYADIVHLIAGGNPALRIAAGGAGELQHLARAINDFAARHEAALQEVTERIREAQAKLAMEHSHLATLMSELAQSVVVCNAEGRVLLYNEKARELFADGQLPSGDAVPAYLGLGRSIYALADRSALVASQAELRRRKALHESAPVVGFELRLANGEHVHARMAAAHPYGAATAAPEDSHGYVLLLSAPSVDSKIAQSPATDVRASPGRPIYYDFDLFHQAGPTGEEVDDRPLTLLAYTAFDTETTGLDPSAGDEIISIGAVRIVNGRVLPHERYTQWIDPRRPLKPDSAAVHGISPETLRGQPTIDKVLPGFFRFCEDTVLIGHNAAFDMRFLELKQQTTGVCFTQPVLDTLLLSAALHGTLQEHSLEAIATRLGVTIVDRHTAIGDALTTAAVFLKLVPLLAQRGIVTLRQAREASARTPYARLRY
jgi:DNA polymerase-3 subunit epsilon